MLKSGSSPRVSVHEDIPISRIALKKMFLMVGYVFIICVLYAD